MSIATKAIPENLTDLRAFAETQQDLIVAQQAQIVLLEAELKRETAARDEELYAKTLHIEKLRMRLATMSRARFGQSSERLENDKFAQMELQLEDIETGHAEAVAESHAATPPSAEAAARLKKLHPVRRPLPESLPRERIEHAAACVCSNCGCCNLTRIGVDERELLEYVPSHFKAVVHVRPKMSCRNCETIMQPPMPSLPIDRGLPGPGTHPHANAVAQFHFDRPESRDSRRRSFTSLAHRPRRRHNGRRGRTSRRQRAVLQYADLDEILWRQAVLRPYMIRYPLPTLPPPGKNLIGVHVMPPRHRCHGSAGCQRFLHDQKLLLKRSVPPGASQCRGTRHFVILIHACRG